MSDINKYEQQQKQEEIKITKEPVEQNQEIRELSQENFATRQKVNNSALGNTDVLPKELVMSSESLEKILSETDGDEEITATKEETLNIVESTLTVPIVSENINKPSYQTNKTLMDAKQGQKVKLADDTKVIENLAEIEALKEAEAKEKLEKQPEELKQNYNELLGFMKEFKDSCLQETSKSNSVLMNNVIKEVTDFETLVNSKEFSLGKQYSYIPQLVNMRNAIALYYEKNKGFKWTSKGRRRRELTKSFLNKLNDWVGSMPDPIIDNYVGEMEKEENEQIRDLPSSQEMYMSIGSAVLKKQLEREGEKWTDEKVRKYLNPDTVRYISMARLNRANFENMVKLVPSKEEQAKLRKDAKNNNGEALDMDHRTYGYQWGNVKLNYDGTPATDEDTQKVEKIKSGMKSWFSDDLKGMKPFYDDFIKNVIDFNMPYDDLMPQNLHKKGPSQLYIGQSIISIQNMLAKDTLSLKYIDSLSPAVKFRMNMIGDLSKIFSVINAFAIKQHTENEYTLKPSYKWEKPLDINKSKKLLDFLKEHPEKAREIDIAADDNDFEIPYFDETQYRIFDNNYFENTLVPVVKERTIVGDYYSSDNKFARRVKRAEMFYKDVPKFSLEHPELEEPLCEAYQKLEDTEEKIASIVSKMKNLSDEAEIEKMNAEKATLESQRDEILREKDVLVEVRNAAMEELEKNPESKYAAYAYEAKKESEREGINITPEALAFRKMKKLVVESKDSQRNTPEGKEAGKVLKGEQFNRTFAQKIRYVNYNNDGQPLTEEDRKNLEWNKAYAKSIGENNQEDRIRLLKENCDYVASIINRVDFDRIMDYDYWIKNKDLYVTLSNFSLNGLEAKGNCIQKEDREIMKEYFNIKTPAMKLLDDFTQIIRVMNSLQGFLTRGYRVSEQGEYNKAEDPGYNPDSEIPIIEGLTQEINECAIKAKKSLADYNASRN